MEKKLKVDGMTCQKCVARVDKIIGKHEGTSDICVSLEYKEAVFSCDETVQGIIPAASSRSDRTMK